MTVKVTTEQRASIKVEPTISYPFLWRGSQSGSVYLRRARHGEDFLVVASASSTGVFETRTTCTPDDIAWNCRLGPHEVVILQNAV